ncbi:hypothetical protein QO002_006069 [Pararhizobium capsulatum DSM 1112]|uniref:Uncharacterized protein n=1 Tax=Pararhizobium capsulatum DSM 1112 TaxID=1121113 RepID=A0ABU0C015_9HYPH|nr:hypothetical protein [Pararhizobium capsulatum]MDQ0323862.1 hypothetical protein [Pararhizobium capsulatum DSM 1112]
MIIAAPTCSPVESEYDFQCQQALQLAVLALVDQATQAGWATQSTLKALGEIVTNQTLAYDHDPDPAEDDSDLNGRRHHSADSSGRHIPKPDA